MTIKIILYGVGIEAFQYPQNEHFLLNQISKNITAVKFIMLKHDFSWAPVRFSHINLEDSGDI